MTVLAIRPAEGEEDLGFMLGLGPRLTDGIHTPIHDQKAIEIFQGEFSSINLRNPMPGALTLIAFDDEDRRLGFIHAIPAPDGITGETIGYIALLAVVREAEGRGVALHLLQSTEEWARNQGYKALSLDVFASNLRGVGFYEKTGFFLETMRMVKGL